MLEGEGAAQLIVLADALGCLDAEVVESGSAGDQTAIR